MHPSELLEYLMTQIEEFRQIQIKVIIRLLKTIL